MNQGAQSQNLLHNISGGIAVWDLSCLRPPFQSALRYQSMTYKSVCLGFKFRCITWLYLFCFKYGTNYRWYSTVISPIWILSFYEWDIYLRFLEDFVTKGLWSLENFKRIFNIFPLVIRKATNKGVKHHLDNCFVPWFSLEFLMDFFKMLACKIVFQQFLKRRRH